MGASAWRSALAIAMLLTTGPAAFAQTRNWAIAPSIGLRGTYTDNVSLAESPEHGEFVTDVSPSIAISGRGRRFRANASYTADLLFYARNREQDRLANTLSASGNLEAIEQFFFVDAQASISQSYISPFAPRPSDITTVTNNRTETRTFGLSPYVRSQTPGGYAYEVRNRNTWTSTDTAALAKVHSREWTSSLTSPVSLFGWGVDASDLRINYDDTAGRPERQSSIVRGRLFFQPYSSLRLSASVGRESNNFVLQEKRSNKTYGYGVLWRPTPRTSTQFDWERRFFGVSRSASFEHRMRLTAWSASYSKNVSNFQQEVLRLPPGNTAQLLDAIFQARIPDPVQRAAAVQEFLRSTGTPAFLGNSQAFFTEQAFVQERLQGSVAIVGVRNTIAFTVFRSQSTALTESAVTLPAEVFVAAGSRVNQHGFGASASHRLTGFTSLNASANRSFAETEGAAIESKTDFLTLNLAHTVSPKTNTFAGLSQTRFESGSAPTTNARSVFAGLLHRF